MPTPEITPIALKAELDAGKKLYLLDVREAHELQISRLEIDTHIPMGEIADRVGELDADADIVVICRSGARSQRVTQFLLASGFRNVRNLASGMNGWAETVDPSLEQY
ncbi:MAG: rhodanese-like domain-containing protein [Fimbriimonadaceae bacterium]|nr:rhodanese-like domain-containing protein [Fimbriimonadaceae bacterium]